MKTKTSNRAVYVCPVCHDVFARSRIHHRRRTICCNAGAPGDERSKPLYDEQGNLLTRAPRWWVEACKMKVSVAHKKAKRLGVRNG